MKTRKYTILPLAALAGLAIATSSANAATLSFTDSFETDSGWSSYNTYNHSSGYTLTPPTGAGAKYWHNLSDGVQDIALTPTVDIDAGGGTYSVSIWLGSYTQIDRGQFRLLWLDGSSAPIGAAAETFDGGTIVTNGEWQQFVGSGTVPVGARFASLIMEDSPTAGTSGSNDGYFDLLDLEVTTAAIPEPSSMALLGLGGLGVLLRRRRN